MTTDVILFGGTINTERRVGQKISNLPRNFRQDSVYVKVYRLSTNHMKSRIEKKTLKVRIFLVKMSFKLVLARYHRV